MRELDIEDRDSLFAFLRSTGRIGPDECPRLDVLSGGVSNRVVRVERPTGEAWVLKQPLRKLRVDAEWLSGIERVHCEALGLRWLSRLTPEGSVPRFVFEDCEHHVLAMEAVPQPHENWKRRLLAGGLEANHVRQFADLLATIHVRAEPHRAELAKAFGDRSFFESLRLDPYYVWTATQIAGAAAFLRSLVDETRANPMTLVHGDFSPKNALVYAGRLVLLDHEVIHFGDPAFDLGFSLSHFLSKAHHLRKDRSRFAEAAQVYWSTYRTAAGELTWSQELEPRVVRHTLACLLARVAGKSPLEYLDQESRIVQREAVLRMLAEVPDNVCGLVKGFVEGL